METGNQLSKRKHTLVSTFVPLYLSVNFRILLWLLPLIFLSIAFFYPLSRILSLTLDFNTLTSSNLFLAARVLLLLSIRQFSPLS